MGNYINYHCHSHFSNVSTPDVVIKNEDRVNRAVQLGQTVVSGIEHGTLGNYFEVVDLAKQNHVKPLLGTEAYFVLDRFEKDSTNAHIILLAKTEKGRKAINKIVSEANVTGFYYKARVDLSLVLSLPKDDVWVTSACLGGIWKYGEEKSEEIFQKLLSHFGKNLFLEVQYHHQDSQKELNKRILVMSKKYDCSIVAGMDTHMIDMKDAHVRDIYLASRGIEYPDEQGWFLDFPDYDTALKRFIEQGILTEDEAKTALNNTNIFEQVEVYNSVIFDKNKIKLPTIYPDKTQDERNKIFSNLVWSQWEKEKKNVPVEKWDIYVSEIQKEIDTVVATSISDYFLLNYEIIKKGVDNGGMITFTGRGSAPSFYTSKLLGFTTIDRISAEVKLYPERFISKERLLQTKSIPDIDHNTGTPEIFEESQKRIMGEGHSYRMLAYQRVGENQAWKLFARYKGIDFDTANLVSEQIKKYDEDVKYADTDEDKEQINIKDYIDEKYWQMYDDCQVYLKLVYALTQHPCGFLLFDEGKIDEEIGLIRTKDVICAAIDGKSAEKYLFLKNDLLKVSVVESIYGTYQRIGLKPDTFQELIDRTRDDEKVWDIYKNGITMGINQFETDKTTEKVKRYIPRNISELSSMVSSIRPGFKSLYSRYEKREAFDYNVKSLDDIIQTKQFPYSYLLYQEQVMSVLAYAGIPIHETYEIVKSIAKKRHEEIMKYKKVFIPMMTKKLIEIEKESKKRAEEISKNIWKVVEDSASYSFNASHSLSVAGDSLYGAYLKSHYPVQFYETLIRIYEKDGKKDKIYLAKSEAQKFFNISFPNFKFGMDNTKIIGDEKTNSISMSLKTIKGFGEVVAENMVKLHQEFVKSEGKDFLDLLLVAEQNNLLNKSFENLLKIDYFSSFGSMKKLLWLFDEFTSGKNRYSSKLTDKTKNTRLPLLRESWNWAKEQTFTIYEQIQNESSIIGQPYSLHPTLNKYYGYVTEVNTKSYHPKIRLIILKTGEEKELKVLQDTYYEHHFKEGDILLCKTFKKKFRKTKDENGKWIETENFDWFVETYYKMKPEDKFIEGD